MFSGMFDKDNSATIDFNEFKSLWQFITQWEKVFRGFDEDKSGSIDKTEFRKALTSFGNKHKNEKNDLHTLIFRSTIGDFDFRRERNRLSYFDLIGMFDQDGSSTIDFQEFRALWRYVTEWEKCFRFACFLRITKY
jgi:Ca2+-binding EF-hand superfamily protein